MSNLVNIFYLHCPENINPQIYKACPPSQNNFLKTAEEPLQSRVSHKFKFHSCNNYIYNYNPWHVAHFHFF